MFKIALSTLAAVLSIATLQGPVADAAATGDMYVLAYTFEPAFCSGTTYPGCKTPQDYWRKHFTIHGLWPQYKAGGYPQSCTTEPYDVNTPNYFGWSTMTQYWPNVKALETDPTYDDFWEHEWTKHGTCSGLTQKAYFNATLSLIQKYGTPQVYQDAVGSTISASTLRNAFGGPTYASLQCTSTKYVNGVFWCFERDPVTAQPGKQTVCPSDVQKEDTCTATTLTVQAFP